MSDPMSEEKWEFPEGVNDDNQYITINKGLHSELKIPSKEVKKEIDGNKAPDDVYLDKLVNDHWKYISDVLMHSSNKSRDEISEIGFHYRTAMIHGWRHSKEYFTGNV